MHMSTEAQFIVPNWGDKVDCGIAMSCRPVRLLRQAGRTLSYSRLYPPVRDPEFGYRVHILRGTLLDHAP